MKKKLEEFLSELTLNQEKASLLNEPSVVINISVGEVKPSAYPKFNVASEATTEASKAVNSLSSGVSLVLTTNGKPSSSSEYFLVGMFLLELFFILFFLSLKNVKK